LSTVISKQLNVTNMLN